MSVLDRDSAALLAQSVAIYAGRPAGSPEDHLAALHEQGWLAAALPEASGGMGFGVDAAAIIAGGLARGQIGEPFTATFLAARVLGLAAPGSDSAKALADAGVLSALAFDEAGAAPVLANADGVLTGTKRRVAGAEAAARLIVTATRDTQPVLVELDATAPGVDARHARRIDGGALTEISFDGAKGTIIASGDIVPQALRQALAETGLVIAAELLAHCDSLRELTLEHLRTRRQFGQSLGGFQALQHKAVDMYLGALLSRSVLDHAITKAAEDLSADDLDRLAFRARARLNDTAMQHVRLSMQLLGAFGTTDESPLGPHIKRVVRLCGWLGTSAQYRARYAALGRVATRNQDRKVTT
ncbi:acyl-CoA dehydrogenase family protein [Pseudooceanicola sp.]|uniref:acyl-CoA dehydrogenase family protein n=1 Tax=Pseudooceanicola sp. TaxID=1914328 RepID=UPI002631F642|nr:acyl-CoA dehydrogenase family protein [Pseudooceanicola sp.]MDF1855918.1 acyl-CoA/acyl-ACP dehydrogenase [Pseudooceanicola sp.]